MAKEPKVKQTTICECGQSVRFHGPTQFGEFVGGTFVVLDNVYRCVQCHREYTLEQIAKLPVRTVELPA